MVVNGRPTLRSPEGERELQPATACVPSGPEGAHQLRNPSRALRFASSFRTSAFPEGGSGRQRQAPGAWGSGDDERLWFRRGDATGYWTAKLRRLLVSSIRRLAALGRRAVDEEAERGVAPVRERRGAPHHEHAAGAELVSGSSPSPMWDRERPRDDDEDLLLDVV